MIPGRIPLPYPDSTDDEAWARWRADPYGDGTVVPVTNPPSYHDLYVTTAEIPRTRLFDLPYGLEITVPAAVTCNRVAGWELWQTHSDIRKWKLLAGEYDGPDKWLILDVAGHVIVNSRDRESEDT